MDLNPEEFAGLADELSAGGFSRKVAGPGAGSGPRGDRYMVGGYKGLSSDYPEEPALTDTDLAEFASRPSISEALSEPDVYLGGWQGERPPRQSIDVSKAYNSRTAAGRYEGKLAAAETNQESIGVIKGGDFVGEIEYPYHQEGASQAGRNPDLFDSAWANARAGSGVDPVWRDIK